MAKTASLNIRLDADIKRNAEFVYSRYGLSLAEAVTVFIHQSCNVGGLPFDLRPSNPNAKTLAAITEAEQILSEYRNGTRIRRPFVSAKEMFAAMDEEDELDGNIE